MKIESGDLVQVTEIGPRDMFTRWFSMRYRYFVVPGDHKIIVDNENEFLSWKLLSPNCAMRLPDGTVVMDEKVPGADKICFFQAKVRLIQKRYV